MEYIDNDLFVYCSDSFLLRKIEKLIFKKDENGELIFTMNQLLPMPQDFSGLVEFQMFGRHWREIIWGAYQDGKEYKRKINNHDFDVHFSTPRTPGIYWFYIFQEMAEVLHKNCDISPEPELVILYAYGEFNTSSQGFIHWEPGIKFERKKKLEEKSRERLLQFFDPIWINRYGDTWD